MFEYNTLRTMNGAGSLIVSIVILHLGGTLTIRGYNERAEWVKQVPGRMVIGSFLALTALIQIEAATAKLLVRTAGPGGVGKWINTWYVNVAIAVAILLGLWSMWRLRNNSLGPHQRNDRVAEATERTADNTERMAIATEQIKDRIDAIEESLPTPL